MRISAALRYLLGFGAVCATLVGCSGGTVSLNPIAATQGTAGSQGAHGAWSMTGHAGTGAIHDLAVDRFNTKIVYANVDDLGAWNENLYGSVDGGKTFKRIICYRAVGAQAIAFSSVVRDRLYLGDDGAGTILHFVVDGGSHPKTYRGAGTNFNDVRYIIPEPGSRSGSEACFGKAGGS